VTTPFRATYRLQFRGGMDFARAEALVPYLAGLGVSHLYASPVFRARPGSPHGYDVVDPTRFEDALGGDEGFRRLAGALKAQGLGIVLDIVPNHMGVSPANPWWWDVLARGRESPYASFFDIDWAAAGGRVVLPVLGAPYGEILKAGELRLVRAGGGVELRYHDHRFPVRGDNLDDEAINADPLGQLHPLLERQAYRLAHWRAATDLLNYRRFFDINDLIGVRVEDPAVFEATHALVLDLAREGLIDGVRLDHIDGLRAPTGYLGHLRVRIDEVTGGRPFLILVEKILGPDEALRGEWPIDGTTGYEFMNLVNGVFVNAAAEAAVTTTYREVTGDEDDLGDHIRRAKHELLAATFAGELDRLVERARGLAEADLVARDLGPARLRQGLTAVITAFAVYRTYIEADPIGAADRGLLETVLAAARRDPDLAETSAVDFLGRLLLRPSSPEALEFAMRLQQLTGPIMAKALEDTAFYRYGRFVSLNEVGGEPDHFGVPPEAFHAANAERRRTHPRSMLATATHDHKRGEDVRARLDVLSEIPEAWDAFVRRWTLAHAELIDSRQAHLFYQILLGCWPLDLAPPDFAGLDALEERLQGYMMKAAKEAKLETSWTAPDEAAETRLQTFVATTLDGEASRDFLEDVHALAERMAPTGAVNGLAQTLLKLTVPGLPDLYQGTERWDLSLVDPDNRRPVDFDRRQRDLGGAEDPAALLGAWRDGRIKQALIERTLALRARKPDLFVEGDYRALAVEGGDASRVLAFARSLGDDVVILAVPRLVHGRVSQDLAPAIEDARLVLPDGLDGPLTDALSSPLSGLKLEAEGGRLGAEALFAKLPVALLEGRLGAQS